MPHINVTKKKGLFTMKALTLTMLCVALAGCAVPGVATKQGPQADENKKLVLEFYERVLNKKDADAAAKYVVPHYIQHNPRVPSGLAPLQAFVRELKRTSPEARSTVKRVIAEGDLVVLHSHVQRGAGPQDRGLALVDIFRIENGMIVEHWDVMQAVPETSANQNGMF